MTERMIEESEKKEKQKQKLALFKQKSATHLKNLYSLIKTSADWHLTYDQIQLLPPDFDFNTKMDDDGNTLLTLAAKTGECHVVEALIKKGAGTDSTDKDGNTALHIAIQREFVQCRDCLL